MPRSPFRQRLTPWLVMRLGLGLCLIPTACQREPPPAAAPVQVPDNEVWLTPHQIEDSHITIAAVAEQDTEDTILTAGKVTFDDSRVTHIYSPVSGRVTQITAPLGKPVKKGDPLAVITSPDIGIATSDTGKAEADLVAAEHDFKRQRELFAEHAASQKDYESAEDNFRRATAEMERARQKQRMFHTSDVDPVSQTYTVRSQIAGDVIARFVNPGMEIAGLYSGGTPVELYTIGDLSRVWMLADLYEMDFGRVQVGSEVTVNVVAYPGRAFKGRVDWVAGALDPTSRTIKVRCTFDNPDHALKPEMYATAAIAVPEKRALAVPRNAILLFGKEAVVYVESGTSKDGPTNYIRFRRTVIKLVDVGEGGPWVPVLSGLEAGQRVVTSGTILLANKS